MPDFSYTLIRQPYRRTLAISISSDNVITVKASRTLPLKRITAYVSKQEKWIRKTIAFNTHVKKPHVPKEFREGETFLYLGKERPLHIQRKNKGSLTLTDGVFTAFIPRGNCNKKNYCRRLFIEWYKRAAYRLLLERVSAYEKLVGVAISGLEIRTMKSTWANCSKKGKVCFSWKLAMAPLNIIDYIVVHELCHLTHHNHSQRFWRKVRSVIADYKECKRWLTIHAESLQL